MGGGGYFFTSHWLCRQHWTGFYITVNGDCQGLFFPRLLIMHFGGEIARSPHVFFHAAEYGGYPCSTLVIPTVIKFIYLNKLLNQCIIDAYIYAGITEGQARFDLQQKNLFNPWLWYKEITTFLKIKGIQASNLVPMPLMQIQKPNYVFPGTIFKLLRPFYPKSVYFCYAWVFKADVDLSNCCLSTSKLSCYHKWQEK